MLAHYTPAAEVAPSALALLAEARCAFCDQALASASGG